jgi:hypothetical protein
VPVCPCVIVMLMTLDCIRYARSSNRALYDGRLLQSPKTSSSDHISRADGIIVVHEKDRGYGVFQRPATSLLFLAKGPAPFPLMRVRQSTVLFRLLHGNLSILLDPKQNGRGNGDKVTKNLVSLEGVKVGHHRTYHDQRPS